MLNHTHHDHYKKNMIPETLWSAFLHVFFIFEIIFSTVTVQTLLDGAPTARLHPHL